MFRYTLKKDQTESKTGFRYRGIETSRLEALTDTVFGFSITLLVVSLEVPKSYLELQKSMYGFLGFIFCTMLILALWNRHYIFFLKYGIEDRLTKTTNFLLLFLLLYYVYPLKYLFDILGTSFWLEIKSFFGASSEVMRLKAKELNQALLTPDQWADLMINFGLGLAAIQFIYFLWYYNAYRKRDLIELNALEVAETKIQLYGFSITMGIPFISVLIVVIWGGVASAQAGFTYLLIPLLALVHKHTVRKRIMNSLNQ
ncbi:MAG: TMEM175 family protein [Bacteroidota bacterium]